MKTLQHLVILSHLNFSKYFLISNDYSRYQSNKIPQKIVGKPLIMQYLFQCIMPCLISGKIISSPAFAWDSILALCTESLVKIHVV